MATASFILRKHTFAYCVWLLTTLLLNSARVLLSADAAEPPQRRSLAPGLQVTFQETAAMHGGRTDVIILPNLAFYVPAGTAPTCFLTGAPFEAVWSGYIASELRNEYQFQVESAGAVRLELNGVRVLETSGTNSRVALSEPVRLNKGTNLVRATYLSPAKGDAYLRVWWTSKGGQPMPIPSEALSHSSTRTEFLDIEQLHLGRRLFLEYRCANCHMLSQQKAGVYPAALDGPSLEGIGSRRRQQWLADWVANPSALRPRAFMPHLLLTGDAHDAEAVGAFLGSLQDVPTNATPADSPAKLTTAASSAATEESKSGGQKLFDALHCVACHNTPGTEDPDPARVSLHGVARKFPRSALSSFLRRPEAEYPAIRMPNFNLTDAEAQQLADYVSSAAARAPPALSEPRAELIARGKELVQDSGCLNCHSLKLENRYHTKSFDQLVNAAADSGCLAPRAAGNTRVPRFVLSPEERRALARFIHANDETALVRDAPLESVPGLLVALRCTECHGKFEGFPKLDLLFGKLRPEWAVPFIAGELPYRPRTWLEARMPAFRSYGRSLGTGLALLGGYPPISPALPPSDPAMAAVGHKLVGADGGLSCVSCHAAGSARASQVFENAGINFAYISSRLEKPYFDRWIRNPLLVDPVSKMPVFFDEEMRSPLADIYNGDGAKQIDAIWEYLRAMDKFPPPAGTAPVP